MNQKARYGRAIAAILATMFLSATAAAADPENATRALKGVKYPLVEAIRIAEMQGGGPAIDAEFKTKSSGSEYKIKVLTADGKTVREYKIDAMTGKVIEAENEPFESLFTRMKAASILKAPMDLATAAVTAQKAAGGPAMEAEVDTKSDTVVYNVKVAKGDTIQEVKLNGSGKVASAK